MSRNTLSDKLRLTIDENDIPLSSPYKQTELSSPGQHSPLLPPNRKASIVSKDSLRKLKQNPSSVKG